MAEPSPIDRAFFRETEDGATVFFPWGLSRRGYRLDGERSRARASRAVGLMIGSTAAIGSWIAVVFQPLFESDSAGRAEVLHAIAVPLAGFAAMLLLYSLWAWHFVEGLSESDLRIPREARLREAAAAAPPWKLALIGAITCALGAGVVWIDPRMVWLGGLAVALGLGMIAWSRVLKRASA